jgi:hypothetical protein
VLRKLVTRPDLNGQHGKIEGYDDQSQRYCVKLDTTAAVVKVSPCNLVCAPKQAAETNPSEIMPPGTRVSIMNLTKRKELNGCTGKIDHFDKQLERYFVVLENAEGAVVKVKPSNVACTPKRKARKSTKSQGLMNPGTMVSLQNLTIRLDLNGRRGKIESYDASSKRYFVKLDSTAELVKVLPENVARVPK